MIMSSVPECPQRVGWKWNEMGTQLCRADMVSGPYAVQWEQGTAEWAVIHSKRAMTVVVATPFKAAHAAMETAEAMASGSKSSRRAR